MSTNESGIASPEGVSDTKRSRNGPAGDVAARHSWLTLATIMALFLVIRLPLMYRQPGGLDEECYAIPGLTVLESGIPRMPHFPQRDPKSYFYLADQAVFSLPPLFFYWEALFFSLLPDVYGTARLASAVPGLVSIWLVYELGKRFYQHEAAGLWAAGLYSAMRTFYFPATMGRPDVLCSVFGLAALLLLASWHGGWRRVVVAGVLLGLGGLTHPLAIVFAIQCCGWLMITGRHWQRVTAPLLMGITSIAVFAVWTPLILSYPDAFAGQFFNNVLGRTGPGLLMRLATPWNVFAYHGKMIWEHLGAIQFLLLVGGGCVAAVLDGRSRHGGGTRAPILAWSGVFLLAVLAGFHPTQFYWCYPTALLSICLGRVVAGLMATLSRHSRGRMSWAAGTLFVLLMLPGSGLRAWLAHLRHWNDISYNAPAFAQNIIAEFPADARYTVDTEFVLDFYVAGRKTLMGHIYTPYFRSDEHPYDFLVVSRTGIDSGLATAHHGVLIRTFGEREDIFSCYAEIYRPAGAVDSPAQ